MSGVCTNTKLFKKGFLGGKDTLVITSDFNNRKRINASGYGFHYGVDLRCSTGTNIYCPVDATVYYYASGGGGGGQRLCVTYTNQKSKYYIWFMHLHTCQFTSANIGEHINEGDLIATSGGDPNVDGKQKAGTYSSGPHLHLEIRINSNMSASGAVDPKVYFLAKHKLLIKKSSNWNGEPFNEDGYTDGINSYFFAENKKCFCEEDVMHVSDVKNGASATMGTAVETDLESNNETESEKPKRTKILNKAQERLALGIWQITKMVMDSSVQGKQLCDSSISVQTGSIQNFFNKVCQKPFVEFFGDTYGTQYYWIIRRPPFDREGFLRMMETVTDISDSDIINKTTQYETGSVYSWYQLIPMGDVLGVSEQNFLCPAVFFPEYASIWGSKPLSVQSIYYNFVYSGLFNAADNKQKLENDTRIAQNVVKDFKFIIESNAYRPFSMSGSVTIRGDRKLKRGTLIRFDDGQVFHIDSVSHSFSISSNSVSKTTTLQLSHGIYAEFIGNKNTGDYGEVSYFNLIDWGEDFDIKDITSSNYRDKLSQWKVNTNCLNYFLAKYHLSAFNTSEQDIENGLQRLNKRVLSHLL